MKIILTQPEIESILRTHINKTVTLATGDDFTIEFAATRGTDGVTATIDVPYMGVASLPTTPAAPVHDVTASQTVAAAAPAIEKWEANKTGKNTPDTVIETKPNLTPDAVSAAAEPTPSSETTARVNLFQSTTP